MSIERELQRNYQEVFYPPMPEPEVQVAAGPTDTVTDVNQPAFTMPGMGKRSKKSEVGQNLPVVAADVAAGGVKGLLSGVGGFGGDIEALYQGVKGVINRGGDERALDAFLRGMAQETILPTSDEVSKWLDKNIGPVVPAGANMSPEMMKAREAGANAGEFAGQLVADPALAVKGAKTVAKGAKALAPKAAEMVMDVTEKTGMPVQGLGITESSPKMVVSDFTETLFKAKTAQEGESIRFKNPLTLKDGARLSGFTNPKKQNVFFGYDKNGELFTIGREYVNPEDIVSSRDSNKTADRVKQGLEHLGEYKAKMSTSQQEPQ